MDWLMHCFTCLMGQVLPNRGLSSSFQLELSVQGVLHFWANLHYNQRTCKQWPEAIHSEGFTASGTIAVYKPSKPLPIWVWKLGIAKSNGLWSFWASTAFPKIPFNTIWLPSNGTSSQRGTIGNLSGIQRNDTTCGSGHIPFEDKAIVS